MTYDGKMVFFNSNFHIYVNIKSISRLHTLHIYVNIFTSLQTDTYPHTLHAHEQTSIYTNKKHTVNVVIYAGSQVHVFLW